MPRLTDRQIAAAVKAAGFPRESWATAIAVALAESGGNSDAVNRANSNGSTDYGLFQINSVHAGLLNGGNWRDPVYNAKMALEISSNGTNWAPWVAYTTKRHIPYMARATRAAGVPAGTVPTSPGTVPVGNPLTATGDFFSMLADPKTWARVGYFVVGGILILMALLSMAGAPRAVKGVAKLAVTKKVLK